MNSMEKVKHAIDQLLIRQKALAAAEQVRDEALKSVDAQRSANVLAQNEVARQLKNVCPGKSVMYRGVEYLTSPEGNNLVVNPWDGVILDG